MIGSGLERIVADTSHWLMIAAAENSRKFHRSNRRGAEYDSTSRSLPRSLPF